MPLDNYPEGSRTVKEARFRAGAKAVYRGDSILCRVLDRYPFLVDPREDQVGLRLCVDGFWEYWLTTFLVDNLRPGMCVVDVGANIGYYSVLMAELVGATGSVVAIEPNPEAASLLRRNLDINGFTSRTLVMDVAAGRTYRRGKLFVDPRKAGGASIVENRAAGDARAIDIQVLPLDDIISPGTAVALVKIDAEGFDADVWRGMERIRRESPGLVTVMEFDPNEASGMRSLLPMIEQKGLRLDTIGGDGKLVGSSSASILGGPFCTLVVR